MNLKLSYLAMALGASALTPLVGQAQSLTLDADKAAYVLTARDTVVLGYDADMTTVPVMGNVKYTATTDADWLTVKQDANGNLSLFSSIYYDAAKTRLATVTLASADGKQTRKLFVVQSANTSAADLSGDTSLSVRTAVASQSQSGNPISYTYDGNNNTYWHSPWSSGTTKFPITLTYTLKDAPHVDYMTYTPRQDGNSNGNFGQVKVEYTLASAPSTWIELADTDFGESSGTSRIDFGDSGVDGVNQVRVTVKSGANGFAACAEMGFYEINPEYAEIKEKYFADDLCTTLKDGITEADVAAISNGYFQQLVHHLLAGDYSTKYRVGTFEAYRPVNDLASELKTNAYNQYENPTGIYFKSGESLVLFVEGIGSDPVTLIIKSFGPNQGSENHPQSSYPLKNGINVIKTANRGNGYISYYTKNYATASPVKIHFALATENGYFDLERGDTNEDWKNLLANATSDILDIRTQRMQVAAPVSTLKTSCPTDGVALAKVYDNVIYREREIMGLAKYGREPKNRQFARPVDSGMFADGVGAAAAFGSFSEWTNPTSFGFWGFGHELGHVNQVRPGFKWVGCGETTNNVYSAWVEHKLGSGYHRLEDENSGIDEYRGLRGGRFQTYLEEGVRKGVSWQLQDGPDYHGATPEQFTVTGQDYDGKPTGTVQITSRNYDHFVKVVPLWQLELYCLEAGKAPDAYGKVIEGIRTYKNESSMSNGQLQMKFMRSFCDSTQINFLPFFEKAGMLRPIDAYIEDYSKDWLKISEGMITELKEYIAAKGYPEAAGAINYINAYNWENFRDSTPLTTTPAVGSGCSVVAGGQRIQVDANVWTGAVGFETYDADGNLLRITMFGLGAAQQSKRYTQVLWPSGSAYIMAVGQDGTRVKCYEPK